MKKFALPALSAMVVLGLSCWSPERARAQRFRQQLDDYTTLAVRAAQPEQAVV